MITSSNDRADEATHIYIVPPLQRDTDREDAATHITRNIILVIVHQHRFYPGVWQYVSMLMLGLLHQFEAFLRLIIGFSYVFVLLIFPRQKVVGAHIYIFSMCRSKEYSELFV